ncbi:YcaO-like family protein [Bacillus gobiensis]|uniref:YcaO-like family protein n=1 Tax=Bacillus gobiensis TaxID=1441095 RepID=UPI003D2565E0
MKRFNPFVEAFHTIDGKLLFLKEEKFVEIDNIDEVEMFLSFFRQEVDSEDFLKNYPHLSEWFIPLGNTMSHKLKGKISFHYNFIIISKKDICVECVLRWLPRSPELDYYIDLFSGKKGQLVYRACPSLDDLEWDVKELNQLLKYKPLYIADLDNHIFALDKTPAIHPECLNHHSFSDPDFFKLNDLPVHDMKDITFKIQSEPGNHILFPYFHETVHINAPSVVNPLVTLVGRGVDKDKETAQIKAVVEAVERFHAWLPSQDPVVYGTGQLFKKSTVDMDNAFLFNTLQYESLPFTPYDSNQERWWVNAQNLTFASRSFIPLDFIQLKDSSTVKEPLYLPSSTGMAGHTNQQKCLQAAILEVIERAGQYLFWVNNIFKKIRISSLDMDSELSSIVQKIRQEGVDIHIWTVEVLAEVPPVFICAFEYDINRFVFSSACDLDPKIGFSRALIEAITEYIDGKDMIAAEFKKPLIMEQPVDHLIYYLDTPNEVLEIIHRYTIKEEMDFMVEYGEFTLNKVIESLQNSNMDVVVLNKTSDFLKNLGIYVKHVFIPQLPSLGFSFSTLRLPNITYNSSRYRELQEIPHPFG